MTFRDNQDETVHHAGTPSASEHSRPAAAGPRSGRWKGCFGHPAAGRHNSSVAGFRPAGRGLLHDDNRPGHRQRRPPDHRPKAPLCGVGPAMGGDRLRPHVRRVACFFGGPRRSLLGRRRLLMAGLAIFTGASLRLRAGHYRQVLDRHAWRPGLRGGLVLPAALSIVMNMFSEGAERNKALGIWGAIGAAGATVGVLAEASDPVRGWQYIFFLNVPIGAAALALAPRVMPESRLIPSVGDMTRSGPFR